jgi:hypothetical protein
LNKKKKNACDKDFRNCCKIAGNFSTSVYIVINTLCTVALYPAPSPV